MSDYVNNTKRPPACNPEDKVIKNEIKKKFDSNFNENDNTVFPENSTFNYFYTMPVTSIPNNQKEFANWLYDSKINCKINSQDCLINSNIKYHKSID